MRRIDFNSVLVMADKFEAELLKERGLPPPTEPHIRIEYRNAELVAVAKAIILAVNQAHYGLELELEKPPVFSQPGPPPAH